MKNRLMLILREIFGKKRISLKGKLNQYLIFRKLNQYLIFKMIVFHETPRTVSKTMTVSKVIKQGNRSSFRSCDR